MALQEFSRWQQQTLGSSSYSLSFWSHLHRINFQWVAERFCCPPQRTFSKIKKIIQILYQQFLPRGAGMSSPLEKTLAPRGARQHLLLLLLSRTLQVRCLHLPALHPCQLTRLWGNSFKSRHLQPVLCYIVFVDSLCFTLSLLPVAMCSYRQMRKDAHRCQKWKYSLPLTTAGTARGGLSLPKLKKKEEFFFKKAKTF